MQRAAPVPSIVWEGIEKQKMAAARFAGAIDRALGAIPALPRQHDLGTHSPLSDSNTCKRASSRQLPTPADPSSRFPRYPQSFRILLEKYRARPTLDAILNSPKIVRFTRGAFGGGNIQRCERIRLPAHRRSRCIAFQLESPPFRSDDNRLTNN
jgi:hypothetical protein